MQLLIISSCLSLEKKTTPTQYTLNRAQEETQSPRSSTNSNNCNPNDIVPHEIKATP